MEATNCEICRREVSGELVVRNGELENGTPVISVEATPDRDWICCDSCNVVVCNQCCKHPESGYCDSCIEKYNLYDDLVESGLIQPARGAEGGAS